MKKHLIVLIQFLIAGTYCAAQNTLPATGNVGIGTTNPSETLDVMGNIRTNRIRAGSSAFSPNSRSSFNSFNTGLSASPSIGWIASDFGANDNTSDRLVIGAGYGGKAVIGVHNYDLTNWGGALLIAPSGGNVGIGALDPNYKLDVAGSINATGQAWFSYGNNNVSGYSWTGAALTTNSIEIVNNNKNDAGSSPTLVFHTYGSGGPQFRLASDGSKVLYLESAFSNSSRNPAPYGGGANSYFSRLHVDGSLSTVGNVGIGTTDTKGYQLAVNGNIRAKEIKVENANWPDYVFAKDYALPSLKETEKHIQEKGHLPGIPSAMEVKNNGVDLGELNAKLLQKIEELTLHLIAKDKQVQHQEKQLTDQQHQMDEMKSDVQKLKDLVGRMTGNH
ncbi:hypothetical protein [Pedobacter nutrimenti]|uniref:Uncharacterized protein n=1 Tax=Pedobacter nutrimenti TaxID=1241337 RepID=A0A318UDB0_9SPHI|nr:hypothetical protein [Pedobacter nutrimenti]PYF74201.1 hypothetical protein B0O44_104372 [Pedobacter nutrimenti]